MSEPMGASPRQHWTNCRFYEIYSNQSFHDCICAVKTYFPSSWFTFLPFFFDVELRPEEIQEETRNKVTDVSGPVMKLPRSFQPRTWLQEHMDSSMRSQKIPEHLKSCRLRLHQSRSVIILHQWERQNGIMGESQGRIHCCPRRTKSHLTSSKKNTSMIHNSFRKRFCWLMKQNKQNLKLFGS